MYKERQIPVVSAVRNGLVRVCRPHKNGYDSRVLGFRRTFFGMVSEVLGFLKTRGNWCTKSDNFR